MTLRCSIQELTRMTSDIRAQEQAGANHHLRFHRASLHLG